MGDPIYPALIGYSVAGQLASAQAPIDAPGSESDPKIPPPLLPNQKSESSKWTLGAAGANQLPATN